MTATMGRLRPFVSRRVAARREHCGTAANPVRAGLSCVAAIGARRPARPRTQGFGGFGAGAGRGKGGKGSGMAGKGSGKGWGKGSGKGWGKGKSGDAGKGRGDWGGSGRAGGAAPLKTIAKVRRDYRGRLV